MYTRNQYRLARRHTKQADIRQQKNGPHHAIVTRCGRYRGSKQCDVGLGCRATHQHGQPRTPSIGIIRATCGRSSAIVFFAPAIIATSIVRLLKEMSRRPRLFEMRRFTVRIQRSHKGSKLLAPGRRDPGIAETSMISTPRGVAAVSGGRHRIDAYGGLPCCDPFRIDMKRSLRHPRVARATRG